MKGELMANDFEEKRSEQRAVVDLYYSVDFSVGDESHLYQFKIWNLSEKGMCLLLKEDSAAMDHIKIGDIVKMKYYKAEASSPGKYLKTKIIHISKDEEGRFKGHHVVGIQILGEPGSG